MRFPILIGICFMIAIGVHAQETPDIQYEVVAHLDIPQAAEATWSSDGSLLAVVVWPDVQIWDTERWELLKKIPDVYLSYIDWNPIENILAGVRGGHNESVFVWNPVTGEIITEMTRLRSPEAGGILYPHDISWNPDGNKIATDSARTDIDLLLLWDLEANDNPQPLVPVYPDMPGDLWMNIIKLEWSRNGSWFLTSGNDGSFPERSIIRVWDTITGEIVRTIFPGYQPTWGPNDEQFSGLSIIDDSFVINVWDTTTGQVVTSFDAHEGVTNYLSWNFNANVIAGTRIEEHLILWDVENGLKYDIEDLQTPYAAGLEWRPNSNQLAIADLEGVTILNFEFGG